MSVDGSGSDVTASSASSESYSSSTAACESSLLSTSESEYDLESESDIDSTYSSSDEGQSKDSEPLYEDAQFSVVDSCVLLLEYSLRHGLLKEAFGELLCLVAVHLPPNAQVPTSVYKLKKLLLEMYPEVKSVLYQYCTFCHQILTGSEPCSNGCMDKKVTLFTFQWAHS